MFLLYVHMCCMYLVANNLLLDSGFLNIYRQEDLECDQMSQSWLQQITVNAAFVETKVAKFTQFIQLKPLFQVCFKYKETFMLSHLACHVSDMMNDLNCVFNSAKHQHEHSDGCEILLSGTSEQQEMILQGILLSPKWTVSFEQLVICVTCFFLPFNMHIWCNLTLLIGLLSLWCKLQSGCRDTWALSKLWVETIFRWGGCHLYDSIQISVALLLD